MGFGEVKIYRISEKKESDRFCLWRVQSVVALPRGTCVKTGWSLTIRLSWTSERVNHCSVSALLVEGIYTGVS
jgi:hypothetical protein